MKYEKEVLEVVRELPGSTTAEIVALVPDARPQQVRSVLTNLAQRGRVERTPKKTGAAPTYTYELKTRPVAAPVRKLKNNKPTAAGYEARITALNEQITELKAWKEEAIRRYPDLAVAPEVLQARKIVAETMSGDKLFVDSVLRGEKDNQPIMRVALKALEAA